MARPHTGTFYRSRDTSKWTARWMHQGRRHSKSGFATKADAEAWWGTVIKPTLYPNPALPEASEAARSLARGYEPPETPNGKAKSWVYVVSASELGRVRIGRTTLPSQRLRAHQTSSPVEVVPLLMVPGDAELEHELLRITRPFAVNGGHDWRSIEALEVVIAYIREQMSCKPPLSANRCGRNYGRTVTNELVGELGRCWRRVGPSGEPR